MRSNLAAMDIGEFRRLFAEAMDFRENPYHPMVWITGEPEIGQGVFIGGMSQINATGARLLIGDYCDIAGLVTINVADSHKRCIGLTDQIERADIVLEHHVFVGAGAVIKGGAHIGHHSVVGAGTVVSAAKIPPYSLIVGNPMVVKPGYYRERLPEGQTER